MNKNLTRRFTLGLSGPVVIATLFLGAAAVAVPPPPPGVTPSSVSQTGNPGQTFTVNKSVVTPAIPPKPDIVFLADTTGSMWGAIANVKAGSTGIMTLVAAAQPDAQFGVAQYKDFPPNSVDPFGYKLDQAITPTIASAQAGINTWSASGGGDTPEAQLNALTQIATDPATGFRAGSARVVVWFGDQPGHDPSNGASLASTTAALVAANIRVIAVSTGANQLNASGQATAITAATGGQLSSVVNDAAVAAAILSALTNLPVTITTSITCTSGLSVTLSPSGPQTVTSGTTQNYVETITVLAAAPPGLQSCTVDFLLNGVLQTGFTETVTINRNPSCTAVTAGPNLWPPNHKMKTITLGGATDIDGNALTYNVTAVTQDEPTNGLGDGDTAIDAVLGTGPTLQVRAERSGLGDGRVYRIAYTVTDGLGGSCSGVATVGVPHDQSPAGLTPIDSGGVFNSLV